jgi:hypothetical protein
MKHYHWISLLLISPAQIEHLSLCALFPNQSFTQNLHFPEQVYTAFTQKLTRQNHQVRLSSSLSLFMRSTPPRP